MMVLLVHGTPDFIFNLPQQQVPQIDLKNDVVVIWADISVSCAGPSVWNVFPGQQEIRRLGQLFATLWASYKYMECEALFMC